MFIQVHKMFILRQQQQIWKEIFRNTSILNQFCMSKLTISTFSCFKNPTKRNSRKECMQKQKNLFCPANNNYLQITKKERKKKNQFVPRHFDIYVNYFCGLHNMVHGSYSQCSPSQIETKNTKLILPFSVFGKDTVEQTQNVESRKRRSFQSRAMVSGVCAMFYWSLT